VVVQYRSRMSASSSSVLLEKFPWLLLQWRIRFKIAILTHKAKHTGSPPLLAYKVYARFCHTVTFRATSQPQLRFMRSCVPAPARSFVLKGIE